MKHGSEEPKEKQMKKTQQTTVVTGQVLKSYQLNKDVEINVYYNPVTMKSEDIIVIISWDSQSTLEDFRQTTPNMTLKQIESLVKSKLYPEPVEPKTELQQIKDLLASKITVEQAEKYTYVAIDLDGQSCLFVDKPELDPDCRWWFAEPMYYSETFSCIGWVPDEDPKEILMPYVRSNTIELCFEIADLKGVN